MFSLIPSYYRLRQYPENGLTLLELLVSVVIVGILSAVAVPSMFQQSLKARQAAAKSYIGSVNRAQQTYRLEFPVFANSMANLEIDLPLASDQYTFQFGITNSTLGEFQAIPNNNDLDAITGCVFATIVVGSSATTTSSMLEQSGVGGAPAVPPSC
ncbi:type IV pilin-like G/H family protein [Acaryochloris sp. CCMEE 5410]|uniref:type IV pilin-like G/H family protein n=1 Tax=Acaryochloris sp. CCMEE 5410 TaxID=310037 RepID=UPI000494CDF4|nr:type IV pilin-like G/H family protein [Acaryochloris sp. CCMEE 5410]KAI9134514.1 prepilin-type N-terminal cleavage/methylation domain-containing protein [Acaryochloris sp. CCMEE 5410]